MDLADVDADLDLVTLAPACVNTTKVRERYLLA